MGLELRKIREDGRNRVEEKGGYESLRERAERSSLNHVYLSIHLDFNYEATTIGKLTFEASFCTQESPKAKSGWGRYGWLK